MRIGIMGGTFDPIHNGHLMLAEEAYRQFDLEQIWFMPSANPPHKKESIVAKAEYRKAMVKLAIEKYSFMKYDNTEFERDGYIYSVDTMQILKQKYIENDYYFIIGADSLFSIKSWHKPDKLFKQVHMLVAQRNDKNNADILTQIDELKETYNADISLLVIPPINISSTQIRESVASDLDISNYVTRDVEEYISLHNIYK